MVVAEYEPPTEGVIEIIDAGSGNRVVTVIEVLSPTNKVEGPGLEQYLRKQRTLLDSRTNLVEIDLLRSGRHVLAVALFHIEPAKRTSYMACVRRTTDRGYAQVYPMPIHCRLPTVKIPLRDIDADATLELQPLIDKCYRMGRYDGDIDYSLPSGPPLVGADAQWADQLLKDKGLRPKAS